LKKLGPDGQAAALRLKAEIKDVSTPVWKKYWWAGVAGVVVVAGLILWQTGLRSQPPANTSRIISTPVLVGGISVNTLTPMTALSGTSAVIPSGAADVTPMAGPIKYAPTQAETVFDKDKLVVGIALSYLDEEKFGSTLVEGLSKIGIKTEANYFGENNEAETIMRLIDKGIKILVFSPWESQYTSLLPALESARKQGIKVVTLDRLLYEDGYADAFVRINPTRLGEAQADYLISKAGNRKRIPLYLYAGQPTEDDYYSILFESAYLKIKPRIEDGTFIIGNQDYASQGSWINNPLENSKKKMDFRTNYIGYRAGNLAKANLAFSPSVMRGDVFILAPEDLVARQIADVFSKEKTISSYVITGIGSGNAGYEIMENGDRIRTIYLSKDNLFSEIFYLIKAYSKGAEPTLSVLYDSNKKKVPSSDMKIVEMGTEAPSGPVGGKYTSKSCDRMQIKSSSYKYKPSEDGQKYIRYWTVKNDGSCVWTKEYSIVFKEGDLMGGNAIYHFPHGVLPGELVNIEIELEAPSDIDLLNTTWVLMNDKEEQFVEKTQGVWFDNTDSSLTINYENSR
jgi:putative multiple sugar transport system substrate-binding protein